MRALGPLHLTLSSFTTEKHINTFVVTFIDLLLVRNNYEFVYLLKLI